MTLDDSVRLIVLQFNFSNPNVIPRSIKISDQEQSQKEAAQKPATGKLLFETPEKISLERAITGLLETGYEMTDAFCKVKTNGRGKPNSYSAFFIFAKRENARITEKFWETRKQHYLELFRLCREALWQIKVFYNPLFENGKETAGQRAVNILAQNRQPLFQSNGSRIFTTKQEGTLKIQIPVMPSQYLQIKSNAIQVIQC